MAASKIELSSGCAAKWSNRLEPNMRSTGLGRPHDLSRPRGAGKFTLLVSNVIQLTVSTVVSGCTFQKAFQELVSKGVSEFHSDSRSNQLVQKPDFRTHFNRVILKPSRAFTSQAGSSFFRVHWSDRHRGPKMSSYVA